MHLKICLLCLEVKCWYQKLHHYQCLLPETLLKNQFTLGPGSLSAVCVYDHSLTSGNRSTLEAKTKLGQNNCQQDIWDDLWANILLFIVFCITWPAEFIRKYIFVVSHEWLQMAVFPPLEHVIFEEYAAYLYILYSTSFQGFSNLLQLVSPLTHFLTHKHYLKFLSNYYLYSSLTCLLSVQC